MPAEHWDVGVVVARRRLKGPWADHAWLPVAVLPEPPEVAPLTPLGRDGGDERFYLGPASLLFHSVETGRYRDNLMSGRPSVWVALRPVLGDVPIELLGATVDPAEGEALTEAGTDIVEALPMPATIAEALERFVAAHHVDRPFVKRKRDRADPEALAHGRGFRRRLQGEDG